MGTLWEIGKLSAWSYMVENYCCYGDCCYTVEPRFTNDSHTVIFLSDTVIFLHYLLIYNNFGHFALKNWLNPRWLIFNNLRVGWFFKWAVSEAEISARYHFIKLIMLDQSNLRQMFTHSRWMLNLVELANIIIIIIYFAT